jgi:hypothetical protein
MRRVLVCLLLLSSLACGSALAQQFSSLEERMTEAEFKAAGLDKLSPAELDALNGWIASRSGGGAVAAAGVDTRGLQPERDGSIIVSSVTGEFRGWDGRGERITLDNGQVWEVVDSSSRLKIKVDNPVVTVQPGILDSWEIKVEGYNTRAKVRRIK